MEQLFFYSISFSTAFSVLVPVVVLPTDGCNELEEALAIKGVK